MPWPAQPSAGCRSCCGARRTARHTLAVSLKRPPCGEQMVALCTMASMADLMDGSSNWPSLPVEHWQATRDTVHMWTQIVGKTRLALEPRLNHWWSSTLYVSVRGLTTSLMPYPGGGAEIELDFTRHELTITTTGGAVRRMPLAPRTVADFYAEFRSHLKELGIDAPVAVMPNEIVDVIPF